MKKQSKITNLLVLPLIAYAIFLASPVLAENKSPTAQTFTHIRHKSNQAGGDHVKKGIVGTVTSINGGILMVTSKNDVQYTVVATDATIMNDAGTTDRNPKLVTLGDVKVGDAIVVRGVINNTEVDAEKIFDGKMHGRNFKGMQKGGHQA